MTPNLETISRKIENINGFWRNFPNFDRRSDDGWSLKLTIPLRFSGLELQYRPVQRVQRAKSVYPFNFEQESVFRKRQFQHVPQNRRNKLFSNGQNARNGSTNTRLSNNRETESSRNKFRLLLYSTVLQVDEDAARPISGVEIQPNLPFRKYCWIDFHAAHFANT